MTMPTHETAATLRLALRALALTTTLTLLACSSPPAPEKHAARPDVPPRNLVAEVRAAGANGDDSLEVQPLRDPVVEDLRADATRAEAAGKHEEADGYIRQALAFTPDDPELLQWRAELLLAQDFFDEAAILANRSFEQGPKLGALCRRNWTTIKLAREMRGNDSEAGAAAQQAARCTIEPPVRM